MAVCGGPCTWCCCTSDDDASSVASECAVEADIACCSCLGRTWTVVFYSAAGIHQHSTMLTCTFVGVICSTLLYLPSHILNLDPLSMRFLWQKCLQQPFRHTGALA
jgi:hypothetical protein